MLIEEEGGKLPFPNYVEAYGAHLLRVSDQYRKEDALCAEQTLMQEEQGIIRRKSPDEVQRFHRSLKSQVSYGECLPTLHLTRPKENGDLAQQYLHMYHELLACAQFYSLKDFHVVVEIDVSPGSVVKGYLHVAPVQFVLVHPQPINWLHRFRTSPPERVVVST